MPFAKLKIISEFVKQLGQKDEVDSLTNPKEMFYRRHAVYRTDQLQKYSKTLELIYDDTKLKQINQKINKYSQLFAS